MTLDRGEFDAIGLKFEVRAHDGDTTVAIYSKRDFAPAFHLRVQEAMQFLTARSVFWRARLIIGQGKEQLEISSPMKISSLTKLEPPISSAHAREYHDYGWTLFAKFLEYGIRETRNTFWNPAAYHIHNARESSANSIDSQAVGYCVAVEAIAGLIDIEENPIKAELVSDFRKRMLEWFANQGDLQELRPRIEGLAVMLSQERVQDRLHTLAATGHVDHSYITSWSTLRNRHVHPKLKDLKKPSQSDFEKLIRLTRMVQVLLYQLMFYLIGYSGPFTDYGSASFPSKQYPLA